MTDTVVARAEPQGISPPSPIDGLMRIMELASEKNMSAESVEKFVTLFREEQDRAAKREFAADFAEFQQSCPPIPRTSDTAKPSGATTQGARSFAFKYAALDEIADTVRPHLHKHGFSYTWDSELTEGGVKATATLRHCNGHSISATFACPIDASSSMNAMQKVASARTYACRYALIQVLGITTGEPDDDVRPEAVTLISREQINELQDLLTSTKANQRKFFVYIGKNAFDEFTEQDYRKGKAALEQWGMGQK